MAITHKITNKNNNLNTLLGSLEHSFGATFDFQVAGARDSNGFWLDDWDIEEILRLPENLFAIVQFKDEDYDAIRTFWRTEPEGWTESDGDYYSDRELLSRVKDYASNGKFEVLFAGVPDTKAEDEDEGF